MPKPAVSTTPQKRDVLAQRMLAALPYDRLVDVAGRDAAKDAARSAELIIGFQSKLDGSRGLFITKQSELIEQDGQLYRFVNRWESVRVYQSIFRRISPGMGDINHGTEGLDQWLELLADYIQHWEG